MSSADTDQFFRQYSNGCQHDSMNACFTTFDQDRDDRWSVSEFGGLCRALFRDVSGSPYPLEAKKLAEIFSVFDRNEDGFIDKTEFENCWHNWIKVITRPTSALVIVDVQNDFISGSLAVSNCPAGHNGEEVVPVVNAMLDNGGFETIVYSMDWHPSCHLSFVTNVSNFPMHHSSKIPAVEAQMYDKVVFDGNPVKEQVLWPAHCVQESWGAELHPDLKIVDDAVWIKKGYDPSIDSYSAFFDNAKRSDTGLSEQLKRRGITDVYVCGIATDICVAATALHSLDEGFRTVVVRDACRGVNQQDIDAFQLQFVSRDGAIVDYKQVGSMLTGQDRRPDMGYKLALQLLMAAGK